MRDIVQKIIRGIELDSRQHNNEIDYIEDLEYKMKRYVSDSELLRIVEALDSRNVEVTEDGHRYLSGIISVKVNYNIDKYEEIKGCGGELVLNHKRFVETDDGSGKYTVQVIYEEGDQTRPRREYFRRLMAGSGHSRSKKALFVRSELYDKVDTILMGGIREYAGMNGYPDFKGGYAKWNSYYALASTDSNALSRTPGIIIIDDYYRTVRDTFDLVCQHKALDPDWKEAMGPKKRYLKKYEVKRGMVRDRQISCFDGAGLVSVECAREWALELGIVNSHGKSYIPAAFQIRAIPGFKGNAYTFDIRTFGRLHGNQIIDIKGELHDIRRERVDLILTRSQAKFIGLFEHDVSLWRKEFDRTVIFPDQSRYKRTFNISEYSDDTCDVKQTMRSAYQHLQTVSFRDKEIESFTERTVREIRRALGSVEGFLSYRGCTEEQRRKAPREWQALPPYYKAAFYLSERDGEAAQTLFGDEFFRSRVREDINGLLNRAKSGKEIMEGNYQVLTPDVYALAQYAFGERDDSQIGLLKAGEVYSCWWMNRRNMPDGKGRAVPDELALIRNPHIFMEARTVKLVRNSIGRRAVTNAPMVQNRGHARDMPENQGKDRLAEMKRWYRYQTTGIITDTFSTVVLALGTADFDGDHIASTNSPEYIEAVKRARVSGEGNTVDLEVILSKELKREKEIYTPIDVSDIRRLMESDCVAFLNDIGSVINKVTVLWNIEKTDENREKVMACTAIADILGQLTIDAAKTGEFEQFCPEINDYLKEIKASEPYFKKYLPGSRDRKKREERSMQNAALFFPGNEEVLDAQKRFSDFYSNMNRICHYMESKIDGIAWDAISVEPDVGKLTDIFQTGEVNVRSELYKRVRHILLRLMREHGRIAAYNREEDIVSEEKEGHYRYFYAYARQQLTGA